MRTNGAIDINGANIDIANASGHGEPPKQREPKVSGSGTDDNPCGLVHVNGNDGSFVKGFLVGQSVHLNGNNFNLEGIGSSPSGTEKSISLIE